MHNRNILTKISTILLTLSLTSISIGSAQAATSNDGLECGGSKVVDYAFVYVRGSQEGGTVTSAKNFKIENSYSENGYLKSVPIFVNKTTDEIKKTLTNKAAKENKHARFSYLFLSYPAYLGKFAPANTTELKNSFETYNASVATGVKSLESVSKTYSARCSAIKVIAIGYSQGSEVIERFMSKSGNDVYAKQLYKAILIGNPLYTKNAKNIITNPGVTAVSGKGLTRYAVKTAPVVRSVWNNKVVDFCIKKDNICNLPSSIGTEVIKAAVDGKFTTTSVNSYKKVDWVGHYDYLPIYKQMAATVK